TVGVPWPGSRWPRALLWLQNEACASMALTMGFAPLLRGDAFAQTTARHPLPKAEGRCKFAEDRTAHRQRSCASVSLTLRRQRQRLSFLGRGVAPNPTSPKAKTFNSLCWTRPAVPTREAHRLPQSARYVSAIPCGVKPIWA